MSNFILFGLLLALFLYVMQIIYNNGQIDLKKVEYSKYVTNVNKPYIKITNSLLVDSLLDLIINNFEIPKNIIAFLF